MLFVLFVVNCLAKRNFKKREQGVELESLLALIVGKPLSNPYERSMMNKR